MSQAVLDFDAGPAAPRPLTIQERFAAFDRANPHVYRLLVRFAFEAKARRTRYSLKALFERIRWHVQIETGGEEFKLNNLYTSRYARKLIAEYPEFEGFFETRELKAA